MESQHATPISQPNDHVYQFVAPDSRSTGSAGTFFVARTGGLLRSADGGQTWDLAYKNLGAAEVLPTTAVALAPDFEHEPTVFAGLNGAILCSYDGGINWRQSRLPNPPPAISALAVSPKFAEDGIVFAGTGEDGVLVSNDRGKSWAAWNFGLLDLSIFCLALSPDFAADETVYAGAESGLFRSTNGGRAWKEVALPIGFDAVLSLALSPRFAQDHALFVGTENYGLLISRDRGKSWAPISESTRDQPVNSIVMSPRAPNQLEILLLHGGGLLVSKNSGQTWKPWRTRKFARRDATAILAPHGFGEGILVGFADGGISRL
jgi:photosystem II stability/assembly factor-like uncharacterized protein